MLTVSLQLVVTCQRQTCDQYCYNVTREHWCYHGGATVNIKRNSLPVHNPDITYGLFRRQLCYYYYFRHFDFTLKSGTFGVTGRSCQDAGQHGTNLGHPGKSGTGGNNTSSSVYSIDSVARANYRQLILATLYVYLCRDKLRSWQHIPIHIHNSHQIRTRNLNLNLITTTTDSVMCGN